jgi:hypothetical protein
VLSTANQIAGLPHTHFCSAMLPRTSNLPRLGCTFIYDGFLGFIGKIRQQYHSSSASILGSRAPAPEPVPRHEELI